MFAPGADSLPPLSLLQHVSEWVGQDNTVCCESLRQATIHHAYTTPVPGLTGWCVRGPLVCSQLLAKAKVSGSAAVTGKGGTDSMQVKSCVYFLSKSKDLTLRSGTLPFFSVFFFRYLLQWFVSELFQISHTALEQDKYWVLLKLMFYF